MKSQKENVLSGKNNKRLNNTDMTNNEGTAAWTNVAEVIPQTQVTIPSEDNTLNAKDWVDDGSRL